MEIKRVEEEMQIDGMGDDDEVPLVDLCQDDGLKTLCERCGPGRACVCVGEVSESDEDESKQDKERRMSIEAKQRQIQAIEELAGDNTILLKQLKEELQKLPRPEEKPLRKAKDRAQLAERIHQAKKNMRDIKQEGEKKIEKQNQEEKFWVDRLEEELAGLEAAYQ